MEKEKGGSDEKLHIKLMFFKFADSNSDVFLGFEFYSYAGGHEPGIDGGAY